MLTADLCMLVHLVALLNQKLSQTFAAFDVVSISTFSTNHCPQGQKGMEIKPQTKPF